MPPWNPELRAHRSAHKRNGPDAFAAPELPIGHAAALANVEGRQLGMGTPLIPSGRDYLVDQGCCRGHVKEAIDAVIDLENMGLRSNWTELKRHDRSASLLVGTPRPR